MNARGPEGDLATLGQQVGRALLITVAVALLVLFLVMPLLTVFVQALDRGLAPFGAALANPDALAAVRMTLSVAAICVPLNTVFGVAVQTARALDAARIPLPSRG